MALSQPISAGKPGYIQSLVFRRQWLKQAKASAVRHGQTAVAELDSEQSDRFRREPASTHEAALWLSYMAVDFRKEIARLLVDLGNLHRGSVACVADQLNLHLSNAELALRGYSGRQTRLEALPEAVAGIAKTLDKLQTNLPIWNLARGLQLFLQDCKVLRTTVS